MVEKLHPLSIGNAYRAYRMACILTQRLLCLHMNKKTENAKIEKIVKEITGDITVHSYPLDREDALDLGLNIAIPSSTTEETIHELYKQYASEMKLNQPFHPNEFLGTRDVSDFEYNGAYVESTDLSYRFIFSGKVQKTIRNNQTAVDLNLESQAWKEGN